MLEGTYPHDVFEDVVLVMWGLFWGDGYTLNVTMKL